jgi:hypothetical protein
LADREAPGLAYCVRIITTADIGLLKMLMTVFCGHESPDSDAEAAILVAQQKSTDVDGLKTFDPGTCKDSDAIKIRECTIRVYLGAFPAKHCWTLSYEDGEVLVAGLTVLQLFEYTTALSTYRQALQARVHVQLELR